MRLTATICVVGLACLLTGGCMRAPVVPPRGLFTNVSAPLDTDQDETVMGSKRGRASTTCILGLVAYGDGSLHAAAADGRLTQIDHVDYEYLSVLGIYQRYTTVAYGK